MTNKEKYIEIFGHEPSVNFCINDDMKCDDCQYRFDDPRSCAKKWWNMTYMEPKH